jgi:DUF2971 family protein
MIWIIETTTAASKEASVTCSTRKDLVLLCKYLSPDGMLASLRDDEQVSVKFALPDTYNDPFELFLDRDQTATPEEAAFFDRYLGEIPNLPVTCFSTIADSPVMWAHYGQNRTGGCLVFDEVKFCDCFGLVGIGDVKYVDRFPIEHLGDLDYAMNTGKARHMRSALNSAYHQAYFTKSNAWNYEHERRVVMNLNEVIEQDNMLLASVSASALDCIILGGDCNDEVKSVSEKFAAHNSKPIYRLQFSRKVHHPYFVRSESSEIFKWGPSGMIPVGVSCATCGEPVLDTEEENEDCPWCRLTDGRRSDAGVVNMYGLLRQLNIDYPGLLLPGDEHRGRAVDK